MTEKIKKNRKQSQRSRIVIDLQYSNDKIYGYSYESLKKICDDHDLKIITYIKDAIREKMNREPVIFDDDYFEK